MLCRVEMPANEQIFGRFHRYRLLHPQKGREGYGLFLAPGLVAAAALFLLFTGFYPAFCLAVLAGATALLVWPLYIRPGTLFRKTPGLALQTEVTIFTETGFSRSVTSEEGGPPDTASGQYDSFVKAVETRRDFYLFTAPGHAYLIDKDFFTKGSPEELRAILQKAMGARFSGK